MSQAKVYRPELPAPPPAIAALPVDERGYPVPWFVAWVDGKPDHRIVDVAKPTKALHHQLCMVCGGKLSPKLATFVVGPMCVVNRTAGEPPAHPGCAGYSVIACPFLTRPDMHRRQAGIPAGAVDPGGFMIRRNPGAVCLWTTSGWDVVGDGRGGMVIRFDRPLATAWFAEGRPATRAEVIESVESGLPILRQLAEQGGQDDIDELDRMIRAAARFWPAEDPPAGATLFHGFSALPRASS